MIEPLRRLFLPRASSLWPRLASLRFFLRFTPASMLVLVLVLVPEPEPEPEPEPDGMQPPLSRGPRPCRQALVIPAQLELYQRQ